jgi:hypothetical protein
MMEALHIDGHSIKFVDRKLWRREESFDSKLDFSQKLFIPLHSAVERRCVRSEEQRSAQISKRKCPEVVESKARKRRILKRPKQFKNYYTDRKPLSIPCFEFPRCLFSIDLSFTIQLMPSKNLPLFHSRFGEQHPFRGRQTICKFYDGNELINEQLIQIKSASSVQDFERIFSEQLRHNQLFEKSARSIEPYYDTKAILAPALRPFASETCLRTSDYQRLEEQCRHRVASPYSSAANAIKSVVVGKRSLDDFLHLASECYDKCIQCYLSSLDECTRRVESIETQSQSQKFPAHSLKTNQFNEHVLASRFSRLSINLDASRGTVTSSTTLHADTARQSFTPPTISIHCSQRAMSRNDSNNNSTDSTNQLKDPPKIIFSDFTESKQATTASSDINAKFSDSDSSVDKNCLALPIKSYCSEARPP